MIENERMRNEFGWKEHMQMMEIENKNKRELTRTDQEEKDMMKVLLCFVVIPFLQYVTWCGDLEPPFSVIASRDIQRYKPSVYKYK